MPTIEGFSLRFHELLKAGIAEVRQRKLDEMAAGMSKKEYRQAVGYLEGLRHALDEAEAIRKQITQQ